MASRPHPAQHVNREPPGPPPLPSLLTLTIKKAAAMAMSTDSRQRHTLHSQITDGSPDDVDTMLRLVQQHIEETLSRRGLQDALFLTVSDLEGAFKTVYFFGQGIDGWRFIGQFIRLAAIHGMANAATDLPLVLSVPNSVWGFRRLPFAMAILRAIGHQLTFRGDSLAVEPVDQADGGDYWIGTHYHTFDVVPLGELPGGHPYAEGYKRGDPVIRAGGGLYRTFSSYLLHNICFDWTHQHPVIFNAQIDETGERYRSLITDDIPEQLGIAVDCLEDGGDLNAANPTALHLVVVSGFRPGDTVAAWLLISGGSMHLITTESPARSAADYEARMDECFPVTMPSLRRLLRSFELIEMEKCCVVS
mmetsp:Transcript_2074/g.4676  ORF Transcript_2074/g.4676 Transcript_2074/m.4676 type:complete len:362 (-) Transcript_2074:385-1470(-)